MADLTLEIVEGPSAGRQVPLDGPVVLGRAGDADVTLDDGQVSRLHARVSPSGGGAVVEDLDSSNGTFINSQELHGLAELRTGDDLLVGVTVLELRSAPQVAAQPSAVRPRPPAFAAPQREPDYVPAAARPGAVDHAGAPSPPASPAVPSGQADPLPGPPSPPSPLDPYLDARTKQQARVAPLAVFVLVALVVLIFLATR